MVTRRAATKEDEDIKAAAKARSVFTYFLYCLFLTDSFSGSLDLFEQTEQEDQALEEAKDVR